jgi:hypothetical protein
MDMEEIGNYVEPWYIRDTLVALDVDLASWDRRGIQAPDPDVEEMALREILHQGDVADALDILQSGCGGVGTYGLIRLADLFANEKNHDDAFQFYDLAVRCAANPGIQAEVGCLLAHRARIDPAPLWEVDWQGDLTGEVLSLDKDLVPGPAFPARSKLVRVALEAYGMAYDYYLQEAAGSTADEPAADNDMARQTLILDGLRTLFLELGMLRDAELTCVVYDIWNEVAGGRFEDVEMERRFAETRGRVAGRSIERTLFEASDIVRTAEDRERARTSARWVEEEISKTPRSGIAQYKATCKEKLGPVWDALPPTTQSYLAQAEYLRSIEHPKDFEWGPVVVQYGRAVEALLQRTFATVDRAYERYTLADFARFLREGKLTGMLKHGCDTRSLTKLVNDINSMRNRGAHPNQPIGYREMEEVRNILFGTEEQGHKGLMATIVEWGPR